jgi:hypothetical protein
MKRCGCRRLRAASALRKASALRNDSEEGCTQSGSCTLGRSRSHAFKFETTYNNVVEHRCTSLTCAAGKHSLSLLSYIVLMTRLSGC